MSRIRCIVIKNFRCIKQLIWFPADGLNCLIGPGDSGKTTILDAIDICLGARRNLQIFDSDFYQLDISNPIEIEITVGNLDETLKGIDPYGEYLRGFANNTVVDEPEHGYETVLTVQLRVDEDLEPSWQLISDRATAQAKVRSLSWSDRNKLAPTRLGTYAKYDLSWRRGSVLSKISPEKIDTAPAMTKLNREARGAFGKAANEQLKEARKIVIKAAKDLGITVGKYVNALLDSESVSVSGGVISLHNEIGIPLANLGVGSTRLLITGLQQTSQDRGSVLLIDELEYGLEPHRLVRLLGSLGSKEKEAQLQVFMTTHSPVAVRELGVEQLFLVKREDENHGVLWVGAENDIQGSARLFPEAFLAPSVIACEGATEVGFIRGLDLYRTSRGKRSMLAAGVALIDANGIDNLFKRARALQKLKVRTAVLRDDDAHPKNGVDTKFISDTGTVFNWGNGYAIEDALFHYLSKTAVLALLQRVVNYWSADYINSQISSETNGQVNLALCQADFKDAYRPVLAKIAKSGDGKWLKNISMMEEVARDVIGPDEEANEELLKKTKEIFDWIELGQ